MGLKRATTSGDAVFTMAVADEPEQTPAQQAGLAAEGMGAQ